MDKKDVATLYKQYAEMVYSVSLRGTRCRQAAEDVRQQVFMNIFKSLEKFRNECQFKTWIYQITLNECYQFRLKAWRENRKTQAFLESWTEAKDEAGKWEHKDLVGRILDLADPATQDALEMIYEMDMTHEEIARAFGVSRVTVTKRLNKFRATAVAAFREG